MPTLETEVTTKQPGVYMILHIASDTRYVGSAADTIAARWGTHRYGLRHNTHRNKHLQQAWNKYGEAAFAFIVLENVVADDVLDAEERWFQKFKRAGLRLYNVREHVKSQLGFRHSEESKARMSQAQTGLKKQLSEEGLANIRKATSRPRPDVSSQFSKAFSFVSPAGVVITGSNLLQLCQQNNLDISAMAKVNKGLRPSHKGWTCPDARTAHLSEHPLTTYPPVHHLCPQCGKDFTDRPSAKRKFCSLVCRHEYEKVAFSGSGNPNFKHGRRVGKH